MGLFTRDDADASEFEPRSVPYNRPRSIVASAVKIDTKSKTEMEQLKKRLDTARHWQTAAWDFYDLIGEVQFSANLISNVLSRIRLFPGYITSEDSAPSNIFDLPDDTEEKPGPSKELKQAALETLRKLATGPAGVAGILRDAALNLFVAGECFLVREPARPGDAFGTETWQMRSVSEIVVKDGSRNSRHVFLKSNRDDTDADLLPLGKYGDVYMARIWRNHPRYSSESDSSLRPQLENLDMLLLYDRAKRGIVRSRLTSGILYVPDGLSAAADSDGELVEDPGLDDEVAPGLDAGVDELEEEIMDAFLNAVQDEGSAASVAPLILRGPSELGEKIRLITFQRPFDSQITADGERVLERVLAGLDLPKDVVAGVGSAKYANAVVIEEALYKSHIEPLVLTIVDGLTEILMKPVLRTLGFSDDEISRVVVWYDPSAITTKPDKATAATTGYELGVISEEAWRRAHGFSDTDKPTGLERMQRFAEKKGLVSESVTEAALRTIEPTLFDQVRAEAVEQTDPDTQEAVADALDGNGDAGFAAPTEEPVAAEPPVPLIEP